MLRSLALILLSVLPAAASAQAPTCEQSTCTPPSLPAPASLDPKFALLENALATSGGSHPIFGPGGARRARTIGVAATLRFSRELTEQEVEAWESRGLEWIRHDNGNIVAVGTVYGAFVPFRLVEKLRELPLIRAEVSWRPPGPRPLDVTVGQIGATDARIQPRGFDGSGRLIVTIDSSIDVLHPHFFRADAGRFQWLDANESGAFEPGIDGVDLDGDGVLDSRERLLVLDAAVVDFRGDDTVSNDDGELEVDRDWVFADLNGDGLRNVGSLAGFTEEDPGYGEPAFVIEDVDRDGVLEPGEVLVMLGTSKIVEVVSANQTWRRGRDLIDAANSPGAQSAFHASGVASVLLGGQPGYHARIGVAPGVEIVVHSARDDAAATLEDIPQLRAIDAAAELGADAVLHEWTNPYTVQHDGSTNLNAAMDVARESGIVQVTPVGNMNGSGKHIQAELRPNQSLSLPFLVGSEGFTNRDGSANPYTVAYLSLFFRTNIAPTVELVLPTGTRTSLQPGGQSQLLEGSLFAATTVDRSDRGTTHIFVTIFTDDEEQPLAPGEWEVVVDEAQTDDIVWGRIADFYSGWSQGIVWKNPTTDSGTMVYPATADSAFGVAAHAGVVTTVGQSVGDLRDYSGRGPRIDGARGIDLSGPDDPIVALASNDELMARGFGQSWFARFGGTSGAAPHVAGTIALLREQDPGRTADELEDLLTTRAGTERLVPDAGMLPNPSWGFGRLNTYQALFDAPAPTNTRPIVVAAFTATGIDASQSSDPDGDSLEFRFDVDHDGSWETGWQSESTFAGLPSPNGYARVDVRDVHGERIGVLLKRGDEGDMDAGMDVDAGAATPPKDRGCCSTVRNPASDTPIGLFVMCCLIAAARSRRRN